jgi:hypothetical protein
VKIIIASVLSRSDEPAPVIKANSEYPEWVFQLGIKVRNDVTKVLII